MPILAMGTSSEVTCEALGTSDLSEHISSEHNYLPTQAAGARRFLINFTKTPLNVGLARRFRTKTPLGVGLARRFSHKELL
jgi:hypothetical protein